MHRIKIGKKDPTDVQLMQSAEQIYTKMTAELTLFPAPVPSLTVLERSLTIFRHAVVEAAYRDKRAIVVRNEKRKELLYVLKELSKYVDTMAAGDGSIILAAGFSLHKTPESYDGFVPKAQQPKIKTGQIGSCSVQLKTNRWAGARMYNFQYRKKGGAEDWVSCFSSKSSCTIEGLENFQEYEFRVTYVGINPTPNYSDSSCGYVI